jgi:hypothetical protein
MQNAFMETLVARGPHSSLGAHAHTYARVIGSWAGQIHNHMMGRPVPAGTVEAHFVWVLEGRAVQDVWITPARSDSAANPDATMKWYGSTLRVFDPKIEAWRTVWTDPLSQLRIDLVGRSQAENIVQIGTRDGRPIRWTFFNIEPNSFSWQAHILNFDGKTWDLEVDIQFQRVTR